MRVVLVEANRLNKEGVRSAPELPTQYAMLSTDSRITIEGLRRIDLSVRPPYRLIAAIHGRFDQGPGATARRLELTDGKVSFWFACENPGEPAIEKLAVLSLADVGKSKAYGILDGRTSGEFPLLLRKRMLDGANAILAARVKTPMGMIFALEAADEKRLQAVQGVA